MSAVTNANWESEALAGLLAIAADAIVTVDDAYNIVHFNRGAEQIFGFTAAEVLGQPLDVLIPDRFRGPHRGHVGQFASGAHPARQMGERSEIFGRRKNGSEFRAEASIAKLDSGGRRLFAAVLRDVSDRKRAEHDEHFLADASAALAESLEYDETLRAVASLAVPALADQVEVVIPAADGQPAARASAGAGGEGLETLRLPLAARGRPLGEIVLARVSDARAPYDGRDRALARAYAERASLAVDNARLYAVARRATRARDAVLGVVSHDLRNPLAAVAMVTRVLRENPPEGERARRELYDVVGESVQWMNRLIDDLLDVSQIDAGRLRIERRREAVEPLIAHALHAVQALAAECNVSLHTEVAGELPLVLADGTRLTQVFANLLHNAVKFTPRSGTVTLRAAAADAGRQVRIVVSDTGVGISADELPHVFERHWQAPRAPNGGAGLGLAIAKGIIEAHGMTIEAASEPGRGSTFTVTMPAAPAEAPT